MTDHCFGSEDTLTTLGSEFLFSFLFAFELIKLRELKQLS